MKFSRNILRKSVIALLLVVVVIVLCVSALFAYLPYKMRAVEKDAHAFCDAIAIGSDISIALERAKDKHISWGNVKGYTFYFPVTGFDKAVCEVAVDGAGSVTSKEAEMEYD